jgi:hypothetical protein
MYNPNLESIKPLSEDEIEQKQRIFLDEDDDALYQSYFGKQQLVNDRSNHNSRKIYSIDNILYKITDKDELLKTANENDILEKWKLFGRQFRSMDLMFEALFTLSKKDAKMDNKLRVPISALIDYKGFRCLAFGQIDI